METNNNPQANVPATASEQFLMTPLGQELKRMEILDKAADLYCHSNIIPASYQGEANKGNVFIALDMASRLNTMPMLVMQNLYVVKGRPSWSAQFLIAMFNQSGKYTPIQWKEYGTPGTDSWGMRAYAYLVTDTKKENPIFGTQITIAMAKKEGWGAKWQTIPEQMLRYRSASWFIKTCAPEITLGLPTADEVEDEINLVEGEDYQVINDEPQHATFNEEKPAEAKKEQSNVNEEKKEEAAPKAKAQQATPQSLFK